VADLANQYGRQVFHCANRLLSDTHLAEDVTQDVFLKLFNTAPAAFDSISHWPAYLKSMAISTALDQIRRRKRLAEHSFAQMPAEAEQLSNGPFTQIAVQRDLDAVRQALMQLTNKDAQVFCLRHIENRGSIMLPLFY
jgi:RNA polymerase sigma-70 factor, ECF subfamily